MGRDLSKSLSPTSLLKQCQLEQTIQDCSVGFWTPPQTETQSLQSTFLWCLSTLTAFSYIQMQSHMLWSEFIAPCPVTDHYWSLPTSSLFSPTGYVHTLIICNPSPTQAFYSSGWTVQMACWVSLRRHSAVSASSHVQDFSVTLRQLLLWQSQLEKATKKLLNPICHPKPCFWRSRTTTHTWEATQHVLHTTETLSISNLMPILRIKQ